MTGISVLFCLMPTRAWALSAPYGLQVFERGDSTVGLVWPTVPGASSYEVLEDGSPVETVEQSYAVVDGLTQGQDYTFAVEAVDDQGDVSPLSTSVQVGAYGVGSWLSDFSVYIVVAFVLGISLGWFLLVTRGS